MQVLKRRDEELRLESLGVSGAALAALLSETAAERHASRVSYARWAAEEYYLTQCGLDRTELSEGTLQIAAAAILWADVVGIGGREGVAGAATTRHPALTCCGKGRKQATDGGAWSAAILTAALQCGGAFAVNENGRLVFSHPDYWGIGICDATIPNAWRLSILREGLRRAAGLTAWHPDVPMDCPPESLPRWATRLNEEK